MLGVKNLVADFRFWLMICVFAFLSCALGWAQEPDEEAIPTRITSERLRYAHRDQMIEFIGQVNVDRPSFQLRSERLVVHLNTLPRSERPASMDPDEDMEAQVDIEKMVAYGQVFLQHDNRTGNGDMATYWVEQGVLRLEGNAVVIEGPSKLEGDVITLNVREKEVDVRGRSRRRVEGMFMLPTEQEAP